MAARFIRTPLVVAAVALVVAADVPRKPDVKATAEKFVKEAVADGPAALAKYTDKVIELTGTVSGGDPRSDPKGFTVSAGKLKPSDPFGIFVDVELPEERRPAGWVLAPGQKVQVTGVLTKVDKYRVTLAQAELKELEPNPRVKVKAADLSAAYAKNAKDAAKKYGDRYDTRWLFLNGTVKALTPSEYGIMVELDAPAKLPVKVAMNKTTVEGVKAGDAVTITVGCRGIANDGTLNLSGYYIPKPGVVK